MSTYFGSLCALCGVEITKELQYSLHSNGIISIATMIDSKRFDYGLSGEYAFEEDLPLKAEDAVCIKCMTAHKFVASLRIECDNCHKKYQSSMPDCDEYLAGWGCCGHVRADEKDPQKLRIDCGFGSLHDCTVFHLKDGSGHKVGENICDACIDSLAINNEVTIDNSHWEELAAFHEE